jgi:O-antigen ligase
MINYLILFLLFFLPFIVVPFGNSQFEVPKVIISEIGIAGLFIFFLLKHKKSIFVLFNHTHLLLVELLFLLTIYQLLFFHSSILIWGDPTRLQGILLLWLLLLFSLLSSQLSFKKLPSYWYSFLLIMLTFLSLIMGNQNGRAVATLGEPNALATVAVFFWPFVYFAKYKNTKLQLSARTISILCTIIIIFLSGSRSGLLAFGMQLIFYLLWFVGKCSYRKVIATTIFFTAITYTFPFFESNTYENRAEVWRTAWSTGLQHPFLGSGFGNMEIMLNKTIQVTHNLLIGYSVDSAHNIILDWWVQGGIVGVGILLLFLLLAVKNFSEKNRGFELLLLFGIFTALSFNPASVVSLIAFWWLIGRSFAKKDY